MELRRGAKRSCLSASRENPAADDTSRKILGSGQDRVVKTLSRDNLWLNFCPPEGI
jgi:hypothetical protein